MPDEENKEVSVLPKNTDLNELKQKITELPEADRVQILQQLGRGKRSFNRRVSFRALARPRGFSSIRRHVPRRGGRNTVHGGKRTGNPP